MLALLLSAALSAGPASGPPTLTTRLEPHARLTVGDRFVLSLAVTSDGPALVTGPLADSAGVFVVADEKRATAHRGGRLVSTYRLSLAGFAPGTHRLPRFLFLVQSGSRTDTLVSDTASVAIASVLPAKMQDVNGLAPPEEFPNYALWLIPAVVLLLAALALAARRLYRRYRRIQELAHSPLPPWDEALRALEAIPAREWIEAGELKRYYYALSEILKRYIERRFEFGAVEQTTSELLASMRLLKTPMRDEIARFFARSDLVKYAKSAPPAEEAELAISQVREFVLKTRPAEPAPAPAEGPVALPAQGSA
jgi:hypothetical protein